MVNITFANQIDYPWLGMPPLRLGDVPPGLGTPEVYILVELDDAPKLRIDMYDRKGLYNAGFEWHGLLYIYYGDVVYVLDQSGHLIDSVELDWYVGNVYSDEKYLLIASATRLLRFDTNGKTLWKSDTVGMDGVIVDRIDGDTIYGRGEWDPPGGWVPFELDMNSGTILRTELDEFLATLQEKRK